MTLKDLDDSGKEVRAWCFACARGDLVFSIIWQLFAARRWPMDLDEAARRFRCKECGSADHVRLFPASRPDLAPMTPNDFAAALFFSARAAAKVGRRDPIAEGAAATIAAGRAKRNAPKRPLPPPPVLRLVWSRPDPV